MEEKLCANNMSFSSREGEKISKITDDTVGTVLKYFEEISLLTDVTWLFLFRGWNLECLWTKKDENVFTEFAPEN